MKFKISRHSGHQAPTEALDLLWSRLDGNTNRDVRFDRLGSEIRATWKGDSRTSVERKVREEIARRAVFDLLCEICEGSPEVKSDWYAVSPLR